MPRCDCTYRVEGKDGGAIEVRCKAEATHECGNVRLCNTCAARYRDEEITVRPLEEA